MNDTYRKLFDEAKKDYPYEDCFGCSFRLERQKDPDHEWRVFSLLMDEGGGYEHESGDVDDCDTEEEAVAEWQRQQELALASFEAKI
jgi:hypothetical protein